MVRAGADGKPEFCPRVAGHPRTAIGWPVTPESMEWGTRFIWERYGLPIYITENGLSCTDSIHLDGKVHDPARIDFIHRYLLSLRRAIDSGVDVRGYFHWSLLDNFVVQRNQRGDERTLVAQHQCLGHELATLNGLFNRTRRGTGFPAG